MRRLLPALMIASLCAPAIAQPDEGQPAALHLRRLSSPHYSVRLRASRRLVRIGQPAVRGLIRLAVGHDVELRHRARTVLKDMGWASRYQRQLMDNLVAAVRSNGWQKPGVVWPQPKPRPRPLLRRDRAFDRLIRMGRPAWSRLRRLLQPTGARLSLHLATDHRESGVRVGDKVTCRGWLRNTGTGGAWIARVVPRIQADWTRFERDIVVTDDRWWDMGKRHGGYLNVYRAPLHPYAYLASRGEVALDPAAVEVDAYGRVRFEAHLTPSRARLEIQVPDGGVPLPFALRLWSEPISRRRTMFVLPPLVSGRLGPEEGGLALRLRSTSARNARGLGQQLRLSLVNRTRYVMRVWDVELGQEPLWYLVTDPTGQPVRWGMFDTDSGSREVFTAEWPDQEDDGEEVRLELEQLTDLEPGRTLDVELGLTHDLPPGRYRIGVGLGRIRVVGDMLHDVWEGSAFSNMIELTVPTANAR